MNGIRSSRNSSTTSRRPETGRRALPRQATVFRLSPICRRVRSWLRELPSCRFLENVQTKPEPESFLFAECCPRLQGLGLHSPVTELRRRRQPEVFVGYLVRRRPRPTCNRQVSRLSWRRPLTSSDFDLQTSAGIRLQVPELA